MSLKSMIKKTAILTAIVAASCTTNSTYATILQRESLNKKTNEEILSTSLDYYFQLPQENKYFVIIDGDEDKEKSVFTIKQISQYAKQMNFKPENIYIITNDEISDILLPNNNIIHSDVGSIENLYNAINNTLDKEDFLCTYLFGHGELAGSILNAISLVGDDSMHSPKADRISDNNNGYNAIFLSDLCYGANISRSASQDNIIGISSAEYDKESVSIRTRETNLLSKEESIYDIESFGREMFQGIITRNADINKDAQITLLEAIEYANNIFNNKIKKIDGYNDTYIQHPTVSRDQEIIYGK